MQKMWQNQPPCLSVPYRSKYQKKSAGSWMGPKKGKKIVTFEQMSSASEFETDESSGRIGVGHLGTNSIRVKVTVTGPLLPNKKM